MKEFQIFDLNHGLTSLKISNIVDYLKSTFLWFRKLLSMQKHTILLYCRLSTINIFIVIVTRYIGKMITIIKSLQKSQ